MNASRVNVPFTLPLHSSSPNTSSVKLLVALALVLLPLGATAVTPIYKCNDQGVVLYTHFPCEESLSAPLELPALDILGDADDAALLKMRLQRLQEITGPAQKASSRPQARSTQREPLSFGERMTLRKLEMEADGLRRDLQRGSGHGDYRRAMQQELDLISRRISDLRQRE